ncbi:MAG: CpaF family protein [Chloroflexi bacterium]|nr:MAG: CpaF family protein [Chloroflexota bacterium]
MTVAVASDLVQRVRAQVAQQLAASVGRASDGGPRIAVGHRLVAEVLERHANDCLAAGSPLLEPAAEDAIAAAVLNSLFGLGGFQHYLDDSDVEDIYVNGHDCVWIRYTGGRMERGESVAGSDAELIEMLREIAARSGASENRFDPGAPDLDLDLPNGSRLFAVMAVSRRPSVTIRCHRLLDVTLDDLVRLGSIDSGLRNLLRAMVRARCNIIVSGGASVGKTTLIRALANEIPADERVVTIEDPRELHLDLFPDRHPNVVSLEVRKPNVEGVGAVTATELVRWSLRMSPERLLVGEVRGHEVVPMLNAMGEGKDGSMCTVHANSSAHAFEKLWTYAAQSPERLSAEATAQLIASTVHFVVHLIRVGGRRLVSSVREVVGASERQVISNEIYRPGPDRAAVPSGVPLQQQTLADLIDAGFDPAVLDALEVSGTWA